jgi:hypothetical protein
MEGYKYAVSSNNKPAIVLPKDANIEGSKLE